MWYRWAQVAYAEMSGARNEEEAGARISAALGLPSYPIAVNETLRLCTWLKARNASCGYLGRKCAASFPCSLTTVVAECHI